MQGRWLRVMLMSGLTSAWLVYQIASATEAPRQELAILQYGLLAGALLGLLGSIVMAATDR